MPIIDLLKKVCNDCFTERDNRTFCVVRILGTVTLFHYSILSQLELMKHASQFSLNSYATGVCAIIGIISAGISIKNKTDQ